MVDKAAKRRVQAILNNLRRDNKRLSEERKRKSPEAQALIDEDIAHNLRMINHYLHTCADLGVK